MATQSASPLRIRMQQLMRVRNFSPRTIEIYLGAVAKFAKFFGRSPDKLGAEEILEYQLHLRDVRNVSFAFFNQVMCALRFFYAEVLGREEMLARIPFMRRERHLPVVLSTDEVLRLLDAPLSLRDRVLITLTYSAGLRLGEVCRLAYRHRLLPHDDPRAPGQMSQRPLRPALAHHARALSASTRPDRRRVAPAQR